MLWNTDRTTKTMTPSSVVFAGLKETTFKIKKFYKYINESTAMKGFETSYSNILVKFQ
jgi:hypothetical protein